MGQEGFLSVVVGAVLAFTVHLGTTEVTTAKKGFP